MMRPQTEAELAEMIAGAEAPLEIRGGGTRPFGRVSGEVLDTRGLCWVRLYEPAAMTLVVGAGTPLAEVEALLAAEGQMLPFEPYGAAGSTIGGVVAGNVSGPRRIQAGACRDSLIGVRFVDGTGAIVKNGGRVMKNVTGYDLVKLMAGSWGTLGVLSELSFRVLARPQALATVAVECAAEAAPALLARALGSPFDVSGAGWVSGHVSGRAVMRVEGLAGSVAYRAQRLAELVGGAQVAFDWAELSPLRLAGAADLWCFSVKPSEAAGVIARLGVPVMLDWGGGRIWARVAGDARALARPYSGHATRHSMGAHAFEPEAEALSAIGRELRQRFDPYAIFNQGRML